VLVAAAGLSVWAGHAVDAVLIAVIVVANGAFGFLQDYRAERSLESLRELTAPTARIRRDGEPTELSATELAPGDVVLWINLLTDGLPALALGADPGSGDVMERPPRPPDSGIVDRGMLGLVSGTGAVSTAVMLGLPVVALDGAPAVTPYAMTMVFTAFVVLEFEKLFVIRWLRETPTLGNPWLFAAVAGSLALHLAVLYTPPRTYFGTVPLAPADWALIGGVLLGCLPGYVAVALGVRRLRRGEAGEAGEARPWRAPQ
jgi:Ca2+-transporting ATPase